MECGFGHVGTRLGDVRVFADLIGETVGHVLGAGDRQLFGDVVTVFTHVFVSVFSDTWGQSLIPKVREWIKVPQAKWGI